MWIINIFFLLLCLHFVFFPFHYFHKLFTVLFRNVFEVIVYILLNNK